VKYDAAARVGACPTPLTIRDPKGRGLMGVPCGHCIRCRIRKRDRYVGEMEGEALANGGASFWTLTLSEQSLCDASFDWEFWKSEARLLMKRLDRFGGRPRYWLTAELGDRTLRPHAHLLMLNRPVDVKQRFLSPHWWPYGHVDAGPLEPGGSRYVASYLTDPKKAPNLLGYSKSVHLGTDAFRAWCELVADRWHRWGDRHLPAGPQWRVGMRAYPMSRKHQEIYENEYGLGYHRPQWSRNASNILLYGRSVAADMNFDAYRVGERRHLELDAIEKARRGIPWQSPTGQVVYL